MSQLELSLRANLSQSFLACVESGKKQPSVMTLLRIANALKVNPAQFFSEEENAASFFSEEEEAARREIAETAKIAEIKDRIIEFVKKL